MALKKQAHSDLKWDENEIFGCGYKQHLLDHWRRLTQNNQLMVEYITKFDEFLVRYSEN